MHRSLLVLVALAAARPGAAEIPQCGLSLDLTYRGPTFATVGTVIGTTVELRALNINGTPPEVHVSAVDFALDCAVNTFCDDDGSVVAYAGDSTITTTCPGATWTTIHAPSDAPNVVTFRTSPPVILAPYTACEISFKVVVVGLSHDATPLTVEEQASVPPGGAVCANGLQAAPYSNNALTTCPPCNDGSNRTLDACDGDSGVCLSVHTSRRGR